MGDDALITIAQDSKPSRYGGARETAQIRRAGTGDLLQTYQDLSELRTGKVCMNDPAELRAAVREYLRFCREREIFPSIEGLCVLCHCSRRWFYMFMDSHPETESASVLEQFRNVCIASKTSGNERGVLSDASYIFQLKNIGAGFADRVEIVPPPPPSPLDTLNAEEARKRLMESLPDEE